MIRILITSAVAGFLLWTPAGAKTFAEMFPQLDDMEAGEGRDFLESLDYQQGKIELRGGFAELLVPEGYYFLGPEHAEKVLSEGWGNPPDEDPPLGMIFPAGFTPLHSGLWAVEITWENIGYVSDEDAEETDYSDLLDEMKDDTIAANEWRRENGYQGITLVGWAAEPHYDPIARRLHWAKELNI